MKPTPVTRSTAPFIEQREGNSDLVLQHTSKQNEDWKNAGREPALVETAKQERRP